MAKNRPRDRRAVIYARVSSAGQAKRGRHGLERQEEACRSYAEREGISVEKVYREAWTGTDADRPVFTEMVTELLSNGCRTILVEGLDRFARDLTVQISLTAYLQARGIALISVATGEDVIECMRSDPMAEGLILIQGVFAQIEKKRLVQKLRRARDNKSAGGRRIEGQKPFGSREGEAEILAMIKKLRRKPRGGERRRWSDVAAKLNEAGYRTRRGTPWTKHSVYRLAQRHG